MADNKDKRNLRVLNGVGLQGLSNDNVNHLTERQSLLNLFS